MVCSKLDSQLDRYRSISINHFLLSHYTEAMSVLKLHSSTGNEYVIGSERTYIRSPTAPLTAAME